MKFNLILLLKNYRVYILLYLLTVFIVGRFVHIEWINALISFPLLVIIPQVFGEIVLKKSIIRHFGLKPFLEWLIGIGMLVGLFYLFVASELVGIEYFSYFVLALLAVLVFLTNKKITNLIDLLKKNKIIILVIFLSIIPVVIYKINYQFPIQPAGDVMAFIEEANGILQGNINLIDRISFNVYLPVISILLSIVSAFGGASPLAICWFVPFLIYPVLSLGIYSLIIQKTDNKNLALLSAIIPTWFVGSMVMDMMSIRPKTLIFVLFPFFLSYYFYLRETKNKKEGNASALLFIASAITCSVLLVYSGININVFPFSILALLCCYLLLPKISNYLLAIAIGTLLASFHSLGGLFVFGVIFSVFFCEIISGSLLKKNKIIQYIIIFAVILLILSIGFSAYKGWLPNDLEGYKQILVDNNGRYNFSVAVKIGLVLIASSPVAVVLTFLGTYLTKEKNWLIIILISILSMSLVPVAYSYRALDLLILPMSCLSAISILWLIELTNNYFTGIRCILLKSIILIMVFTLLVAPFIIKVNSGDQAGFTSSEYEASKWLKDNIQPNTVILSSPSLSRFVQGVTGNSLLTYAKYSVYQYRVDVDVEPVNKREIPVNIFFNETTMGSVWVSQESSGRIKADISTIGKQFVFNEKNQLIIKKNNKVLIKNISITNIKDNSKLVLYDYNNNRTNSQELKFEFSDFGEIYKQKYFGYINDLLKLRHDAFSSNCELSENAIVILKKYLYDTLKGKLSEYGYTDIDIVLFESSRVIKWAGEDLFAPDIPIHNWDSTNKTCDDNIVYQNNDIKIRIYY